MNSHVSPSYAFIPKLLWFVLHMNNPQFFILVSFSHIFRSTIPTRPSNHSRLRTCDRLSHVNGKFRKMPIFRGIIMRKEIASLISHRRHCLTIFACLLRVLSEFCFILKNLTLLCFLTVVPSIYFLKFFLGNSAFFCCSQTIPLLFSR